MAKVKKIEDKTENMYVHKAYIDTRKIKGKLSNKYKSLSKQYEDMIAAIMALKLSADDDKGFEKCAKILNDYYATLKEFERKNKLGDNCELHTKFIEEFSCHFLKTIPEMSNYKIYTQDVFAGLKIRPDYSIETIKKDVDLCIGREEPLIIGGAKETLRIPAVSIEFKTYIDTTMLGEVMYTARKLKGANPGSKAYLVTMIKEFDDKRIDEIIYDSALDELIVLSPLRRQTIKVGKNKKKISPIEFFADGLKAYWNVIADALYEISVIKDIPSMGRLLAYNDRIES